MTTAVETIELDDSVWCIVCGAVLLNLHCRLRCTKCGAMVDCSDWF